MVHAGWKNIVFSGQSPAAAGCVLQPIAKDERAVSGCLEGLCALPFTTSSWLIYSCLTLQVSRCGQTSLIIKLQGLDPINSKAVKILGQAGMFFWLPLYLPWSRDL